VDKNGKSALHYACEKGSYEAAEALISFGLVKRRKKKKDDHLTILQSTISFSGADVDQKTTDTHLRPIHLGLMFVRW